MHRPVCTFGGIPSLSGCLWLLFAFVSPSGMILPVAYAQDCAQCAAGAVQEAAVSTGEWLLTKQVTEVNVLFVAVRNGQPVGDLSQGDLSVQDDNKPPAAVMGFRTERDLPLRVGMVIDTSNSVTSRFRFEQDAASAFLRQALNRREDDLGFIMGFSNHPTVTQDFAGDPDLLSQGVARLTIGGGTALYDAVRTGCQKMVRRPETDVVARILVVLSDGQNNAGVVSLDGAITAAQEAGVTVYAISTNYHPETTAAQDMAATGNSNLRKLAEQTGGRVLLPASPQEVAKAFGKIGQELRSRYTISYKPADFKPDGRYRKIKIEARKTAGKLEIRARKGYYARLASSLSSDLPEEASNVGTPTR
jgi:Ca-activated chloride channel family protein